MKKVLSIVLSIAMVLCMMPAMAFAGTSAAYSDIEGAACEASVELLSELGVVNGYSDGTYKPEKEVTRAEMAKLIVTALGLDPQAGTSSFIDMGAAEWAIPYVGYAQSLGIINGYGGGKFGPNDNVTYDQAITMIVRALGYTTACNEMQGTWPAVFVQKANELGILKDVNKFGSNPSNRGDIAIMLANALYVQMVYADNEGATIAKNDKNGNAVTMYKSLVKDASSVYDTITDDDVDDAVNNITGSLGAAGKVVRNEDGDVISVSNIKTTYLTGKFKSSPEAIFTADDVDYNLASSVMKELDQDGKAKNLTSASGAALYVNGRYANKTFSNADIASCGVIAAKGIYNKNITLSCTVDGKKITGIYAILQWDNTLANSNHSLITESELTQITKNNKLLGKEFKETNAGDIDTNSFELLGVDSLDEIAEDNVVYVYGNTIKRIEVGTTVVTGEVTKTTASKVTVDGKSYKLSINELGVGRTTTNAGIEFNTGDTYKLYLDYQGNVYESELEEASAGDFAIVLATNDKDVQNTTFASDAKVQLVTGDGAKTYVVNAKKYLDNVKSGTSTSWSDITPAAAERISSNTAITDNSAKAFIVKYSTDSDGKVTKLRHLSGWTDYSVKVVTGASITANGYVDGKTIDKGCMVVTAPNGNGAATLDFSDDEDLTVTTLDKVLDSDVATVAYVYDNQKKKVVFMLISEDATNDKDTYGIVTGTSKLTDSNNGVTFYIGSEKLEDKIVNGTVPANVASATTNALYKIEKNAAGEYKFTAEGAVASTNAALSIVKNTVNVGGEWNLYKDATVYVYDVSADKYSIGTLSDIESDDVLQVSLFRTNTNTNNKSDADYNLVNYIIVRVK